MSISVGYAHREYAALARSVLRARMLGVGYVDRPGRPMKARVSVLTVGAFGMLTGFGLLFAVQNWLTGGPHAEFAWPRNLGLSMAQWWTWALLAPAIFALTMVRPIGGDDPARRTALYVAVGLALAAFHLCIVASVEQMLGRVTPGEAWLETLWNLTRKRAGVNLLTYGLLVLLGHAAFYHARWRAGEREARPLGDDRERDENVPPIRFAVRKRSTTVIVEAAEILWVEAAGNYVVLHVAGAEHVMRGTLDEISGRLGEGFVRISRSALVRVAEIEMIGDRSPQGDLVVTLRAGARLRLTRTYRASALERLPSPC